MVRPKTKRDRRQLLADAKRVIGERYNEFDLGLAEIANAVGSSPRQIQRVFREVGDTEFRLVLLTVRMEHARRLLARETGRWSVRKVARVVGYREASGLRQALKRFSGEKPSDLRTEPPDISEAWRRVERTNNT